MLYNSVAKFSSLFSCNSSSMQDNVCRSVYGLVRPSVSNEFQCCRYYTYESVLTCFSSILQSEILVQNSSARFQSKILVQNYYCNSSPKLQSGIVVQILMVQLVAQIAMHDTMHRILCIEYYAYNTMHGMLYIEYFAQNTMPGIICVEILTQDTMQK